MSTARFIDGEELKRRFVSKPTYTRKEIYKKINTSYEYKYIRDLGKWKERFVEKFMPLGGRYLESIYVCSCCKTTNTKKDNFCPNCGAEMRRENEII